MLIVVEGIRAAGKTTWCRKLPEDGIARMPEQRDRSTGVIQILDQMNASGFTVSETGPRDVQTTRFQRPCCQLCGG